MLTRRILRRVGVVPALVLLPLLLAMGSASIALFGGALLLAMLTKGADGSLRYSLQRVASELLWLPLSRDVRAHAKAIFDTVFAKITQAVVAGGLFVLVPLGLSSPRVLALIALVFSVLWLGTTVVLRRAYLDLFRQALSRGATDLGLEIVRIDLPALELVFEALSSREPTRVIAAMELLRDRKRGKLSPALILYHEAEAVLVRALSVVATPDRKDWVPLAARLLHHPAERVRVEVVRAEATLGLHLVERVLLLRSVAAFEAATVQSLALVAQIATEVEYAAGDTIETEGARANCVFVVASGQVEVTHEDPGIVGRMGIGQLVGGPTSLGFEEHLFKVQALAPTVLLSIPYNGLFDVMEDHFDLTFSVLSALGNEIERTLAAPRRAETVSTGTRE